MTNKKLTWQQLVLIASLIFGMFFGAGNLIFPVQLGQLAGGNWLPATLGFLVTGTVVPFLAMLAVSVTTVGVFMMLPSRLAIGLAWRFWLPFI